MAVLIKNGTISTTRPAGAGVVPVPVLSNLSVNIRAPEGAQAVYTANGAQAVTVLMLDPGTDIRQGDFVTITKQNGHPSVEAVPTYAVADAPRNKGNWGLAYIEAKLIGAS